MNLKSFSDRGRDDLIVITGAGGFIGGSLGPVLSRSRLHPHPGSR